MSTLLQIIDLEKSYGSNEIFRKASLLINKKQKIGVIGRNGAGKSTLFRLITGKEELDHGEIRIYDQTRIGYLEQHDTFESQETVMEFLVRESKKPTWECAKLASDFQLKDKELSMQVHDLSGGYQMRVKITAMLLKEPNLLLLDEPTNFLDLSTLILLEDFLKTYNGTFMIISHDREFLKRTCKQTLGVEHGRLEFFPQILEKYFEHKAHTLEMKIKINKNVERKRSQLERFIERFGAKASKASQAKAKMKQIERLKPIEIDHVFSTVSIQLPHIDVKKGTAIAIEDIEVGYTDKSVAKGISFMIEKGEHIGIVGNNGEGKTTFLRSLVKDIPLLGGSFKVNPSLEVGYYAQHIPERLDANQTVYEYLHYISPSDASREDILRMAGCFLFKDDELSKRIAVLSGGERARLCLAGLLLQNHNCLFLDEPTNHLDFETVEALAFALREYKGTLLFVSHDRTFVNFVATGIVEVKNGHIRRFQGAYDDYVYQLQNDLITEKDTVQVEEAEEGEKKESKKEVYQAQKELKKRIKKIEKEIEVLEKEKKEINDWFEKHPTEYDEERGRRLKEVEEALEGLENEWVGLSTQPPSLSHTPQSHQSHDSFYNTPLQSE